MTLNPISAWRTTPRRGGPRAILLAAAFAATFAAGGLTFSSVALAQDGMGMAGMGGHAGTHAAMREHVEKMLTAIDATPGQRARINAILMSAMQSIAPLHQRLAGAHGQLLGLLTAPVIDRAALERLRAERIADVDQASRVLVSALADVAEVLTPEQRAKLQSVMAEHHEGR